MDNNIGTLRINTWTLEIKNILNDLGFSYLLTRNNFFYGQIQVVIKHLNDQYIQKWFADLSTMPKLCTYNMFKTDSTFEKYLECVTNTNHRTELARFRCSSHNLEIEIGRYNYKRFERQNRVCRCCNMGMIEDEYHFLLVCLSFSDIRRQCLPSYYSRWPSVTKFKKNYDRVLIKCGKTISQVCFSCYGRKKKHTWLRLHVFRVLWQCVVSHESCAILHTLWYSVLIYLFVCW